jgi:zinc transporter 2
VIPRRMLGEEQPLLRARGPMADATAPEQAQKLWQQQREQRKERAARDQRARRKLLFSAVLCFAFMVAELLGGYITGSLAVMTDASHLLSDFASFIISLVALQKSQRRANQLLTYGYGRAEVLGAFTSILLIWTLTAVLVLESIRRIITPEPVKGRLMFIIAVMGICINLVMMTVLGHGHGHGHAHDHHHDHFAQVNAEAESSTGEEHRSHGRHRHRQRSGNVESIEPDQAGPSESGLNRPRDQQPGHDDMRATATDDIEAPLSVADMSHRHPVSESVNVHAAYLHVLGDLIQSIGVAIAALVIWWRPSWSLADPLCTLLFSVIVLYTTLRMIGDIVQVLMEGTPANIRVRDVYEALISIDGVSEVQDLHIWSLSVGRTALSAKLRCDASVKDAHQITMAAEQVCLKNFGIEHATIQVNCVNLSCCPPVEHVECASPGRM